MSLKTVALAGWTCFAIDAFAVIMMLVTKDMGDDAAGRGMATGFAIILGPIVLLAGIALLAGQRAQKAGLVWAGTLVLGLPFILGGLDFLRGSARDMSRAAWMSREGRFEDPVLRKLARAIDEGDTAAVRAIATGNRIDWTARDPHDATILGHAVKRARDMFDYGKPEHLAAVRILFEAGSPYIVDASDRGERLLTDAGYNTDSTSLELMRIFLDHGADPNEKEKFDEAPLVLHMNITVPKLELLAAHGADLQVRSERSDRQGWSTLMNAAYMHQWPEARFFLDHGVSPDYVAPDGMTLDSIMVERAPSPESDGEAAVEGHRMLLDAVKTWRSRK